jgi:hypothetical protein
LTFDFLNAPEFAEARRKVLACLQAALSTSPAGLQPAPAAPTPRTGRADAGPSSGTAGKPTRLGPTPATGTSLDPAGVALRALVSNKDGVVTSEGKARAVACYPADLPKTTNLIDVLREPSMATARQEIVKCLTGS